jgi:hypothetical protein
MPDIPDAFCSHKSSRRTRLKIPSKKGNAAYFMALKDELSKCSCIEKIEANPLTGSALFIHSGDFKVVAEKAEANNIFRLKKFEANSTDLQRTILATFNGINNHIKSTTGGGLDMSTLAFLFLAGAGIYQIVRGNVAAPAWYTAFWYALNIFLKARPDKDSY